MGNSSPSSRKNDNEIIDLLIDMGVSKKTAKTLTYLSHVDESISRTIEEKTNLRQPEVSTALKELRGRGWIEKQDITFGCLPAADIATGGKTEIGRVACDAKPGFMLELSNQCRQA